MAGRTYNLSSCRHLVFCSLKTMFGNVLRCRNAYYSVCNVRAAENGLNVCIALVCLVPGWHSPWLDVVIHQRVPRSCRCTSSSSTVQQDEAARSGTTTISGCVPSLLFADDALTSPSGQRYVDFGSALISTYAVSLFPWSVTHMAW